MTLDRLLTALLPSLLAAALLAAPVARAADATPAAPVRTLDETVQTLLKDPATVDFLLRHPDAVIDALTNERDGVIIAEKRKELLQNPDDLVAGNPTGDVTLVEFFDYQCPYCKEIEPLLEALAREDKGLRIVYKEFPVLGDASVYATRVALAARSLGKYAAFHRAMMAAKGPVDETAVRRVAASVGLDLVKLKAAMDAPEIDRVIAANNDLADALYIHATPTMIIGATLIPGAADIDTLRRDIAAARKGS